MRVTEHGNARHAGNRAFRAAGALQLVEEVLRMDRNQKLTELLDGAMGGRFSRRDILRRGLGLGLSIPAIGMLLAACGDDDDDDDGDEDTPAAGTSAAGSPTSPSGAATGTTAEESPTTAEGTPTEEATTDGTASPEGSPSTGEYTMDNPPEVANADAASAFTGVTLTYYGDSVGIAADIDQVLTAKFTEATGIEFEVIPKPQGEEYATYSRFFENESADMDVMMLDVIWPGAFAQHLVDLSESMAEEAAMHYETIITNNTIDGKLVGIPWFGDFGMLYYRTDLLEKYEFTAPPETWEELTEMAQTIQEGEQASNPNFAGFVFQGNAYEGLTCNALEWAASTGGGIFIEDGDVTIDNEQNAATFNMARDWVGTISPDGVTGYQEPDTENAFLGGNAAFARNWPYMYAIGNDATKSQVAGMFDVAPLPASADGEHSGTVGGWQLGVSAYSENPEAAIEFVRYMTSPEVQTWRAVVGTFVPTIGAVAEDPAVIEAMPFLQNLADVVRVVRPSRDTGQDYNQVSTEIYQGINEVLNGGDAAEILPSIAQRIERFVS